MSWAVHRHIFFYLSDRNKTMIFVLFMQLTIILLLSKLNKNSFKNPQEGPRENLNATV